jgi:hypothetical protein
MNKKFFFFIIATIYLAMSAHSDQIDDNESVFTVTDIKTSEDAGNLEDSMEFAKNKAIIQGFKHLAFKIVPIKSRDKIYHIQEKEILKTTKKVISKNERMTNHSYMATIDIDYDPSKVKDILNKYGIRYRTNYSEDILFIPLINDSRVAVREDWRWKWLNLEGYFGLLKFKIFNRNTIVSLENKYTTLFQPYHSFDSILSDYDVKNLTVVFAEMNDDQLEITARMLRPDEDSIKYLIIKKNYNENYRSFFDRAINQLLGDFDSELKGVKAFDQKIIFSSKVKIDSKTPQVWAAIKEKLSNISELKDYRILSSSIDQIEVELNYTIPVQFFKELLQKHGLFLGKKDNEWFLTLYKLANK